MTKIRCIAHCRRTPGWPRVPRQRNRCRIALDDRRVRVRQITAGRPFRSRVQIDRGSANRRIRIERLRSYQQPTIKRAELLPFVRKGTITLGASLHTGDPLNRNKFNFAALLTRQQLTPTLACKNGETLLCNNAEGVSEFQPRVSYPGLATRAVLINSVRVRELLRS